MKNSSFAIAFAKANVALLGLLFAGLGLSGVLPIVLANLLIAIPTFIVLELILAIVTWQLSSLPTASIEPDFQFHSLKREQIEIRFATEADFSGTERVYNSYFDPQLSMHDGDFCELMKRGHAVRVVEEKYASGSEKSTRITGYYALWPLRETTYAAIIAGEIKEESLAPQDIPHIDDPSTVVLYLSEVCIAKDTDIGAALMRDMFRYGIWLLTKYPNIRAVGAWPYTKDGRRWAKELRLKPCSKRFWGRRIYQLERNQALVSPLIPKSQFKERWVVKY